MGFDVFRDDDGYALFLSPPLVPSEQVETGLSRSDLIRRLKSFDVPVRGQMGLLAVTDAEQRLRSSARAPADPRRAKVEPRRCGATRCAPGPWLGPPRAPQPGLPCGRGRP